MPELSFSLAGTPLVVASDDRRLLDVFERALAPLRASGPALRGFRCEARFGDPDDVPANARIHFEGTPPLADGFCVLGEDGEQRFLIFPKRVAIVASLAERRASVMVKPGEERCLAGLPLMHLIDWILEADAQTLVHGAAFAEPSGARGFLVFAPSGAGKTTLALALLKGGFRLFSDDLAVLAKRDGRVSIGGLARALKVHRETARLMPWLGVHLGDAWDLNGEQSLPLVTAARIGPLASEPVPLAAIVRLAGRKAGDHALKKTPNVETLMALCAENLRMGRAGIPEFERQTFRRLGGIVSQAPTYDLFVGTRIEEIPSPFERVLSEGAVAGRRD